LDGLASFSKAITVSIRTFHSIHQFLSDFKVKGLRNGVNFTASISVDLSAAELHPGDILEKIIEDCARLGVNEFKKADFQFEGLTSI
jgi:hypothetical protein